MLTPDITIPVSILSERAAIYAWRRGSEYLYIGQSLRVLQRLRTHHVLGAAHYEKTDVIDVWFCDPGERLKLEARMIKQFKPPYNIKGNEGVKFDTFKESFRHSYNSEEDRRIQKKVQAYIEKFGHLKS
jgi:excinuclease UvrABC nuclease subunit